MDPHAGKTIGDWSEHASHMSLSFDPSMPGNNSSIRLPRLHLFHRLVRIRPSQLYS
jgi:hypothetical protein